MSEYLNLKGTLSLPTEIRGSIDVSQNATATAEDIKKGKTAVVKGELIEGTFEETECEDISLGTTATPNDMRQGKTAAVNGEVIEGSLEEIDWVKPEDKIWPTGAFQVFKNTIYDKDSKISVNMSEVEKTLKAENIRAGITVRYLPSGYVSTEGVDVFTGTFTADATATPETVLKGYTFCAQGETKTGAYEPPKIDGLGYNVTFGSELPTHGCKVRITKVSGSPYISTFKTGSGNLTSLEVGDDVLEINEDGSSVTYFRITDSTGRQIPESLEQARTAVYAQYIT